MQAFCLREASGPDTLRLQQSAGGGVQEEWRPVVGYEGLYEVSNLGRVRRRPETVNRRVPDVLSPFRTDLGRVYVCLCVNNKRTYKTVHGLVATAFIGPRPRGLQIDHIDGDPTNNVLANLEYVTPKENIRRAESLGLRPRGSQRSSAKLTDEQVREIRRLGGTMLDRELAELFGVSRPTVNSVKNRKHYSDVA